MGTSQFIHRRGTEFAEAHRVKTRIFLLTLRKLRKLRQLRQLRLTCDIKDPTQNIVWVTPEGGGGPNYAGM